MENREKSVGSKQLLVILLASLGIVTLFSVFQSEPENVQTDGVYAEESSAEAAMVLDDTAVELTGELIGEERGVASRQPTPGYADATGMDAQERALYEADPDSEGYTDEDLQFFEEHGVTAQEFRAVETMIGNPD